jgi:flagellar hook-associated protein 2
MATITSLGVGSGLNAESIIASLMAIERRPIDLITASNKDINAQLSSMGKLQSLTSTMKDKAAALTTSTLWGQQAFTSSDSTVITGSAGTSAAPGRYAISVQQLAANQTVTSAAFGSSASELNAGTLKIELGTWNTTAVPKTFAPGSEVSIDITDGNTSLAAIRDKINTSGAGITASIINDASGARLSLRSSATGEANGFRITATETLDDGNSATGLSALGFDAGDTSTPMNFNQWGANAQANINGIDVSSSTNTFDAVSDGLSITVGKVSATPVEVTVAADNSAVQTAITDFVKSFNDLASYIKDQTKYDATSKVGGPLQGDRTAIGLQLQLRGVINQGSSASSVFSRLTDIGIAMKSDGTLGTDSTKLTAALANPAELQKLLAADTGETASSGFMDRFRDLGTAATAFDGGLQTRQDALNAQIKRNSDRSDALTQRLTAVEARMRAQYQALDTSMASLSALSSYVTQQFAYKSS